MVGIKVGGTYSCVGVEAGVAVALGAESNVAVAIGVLANDVCIQYSMDGLVSADGGTKVTSEGETGIGVGCEVPPHADKSKYKMTKTPALRKLFILAHFP